MSSQQLNVPGQSLEICCLEPRTGFLHNGLCESVQGDFGQHTVCAVMILEFLEFSKEKGNDLMTALQEYGFPGLAPGDRWCLCLNR